MSRIFLDACIVIYLLEGRSTVQKQLMSLLAGKQIVSSELVRMESRLKPLRNLRQDLLAIYDA